MHDGEGSVHFRSYTEVGVCGCCGCGTLPDLPGLTSIMMRRYMRSLTPQSPLEIRLPQADPPADGEMKFVSPISGITYRVPLQQA